MRAVDGQLSSLFSFYNNILVSTIVEVSIFKYIYLSKLKYLSSKAFINTFFNLLNIYLAILSSLNTLYFLLFLLLYNNIVKRAIILKYYFINLL